MGFLVLVGIILMKSGSGTVTALTVFLFEITRLLGWVFYHAAQGLFWVFRTCSPSYEASYIPAKDYKAREVCHDFHVPEIVTTSAISPAWVAAVEDARQEEVDNSLRQGRIVDSARVII